MAKTKQTSRLCKIVYFDEDSVTDFMQIVAGGKLEKTTELFNETGKEGATGIKVEASVGVGGLFKSLVGFGASASNDSDLQASFNANKIVKNIVKNTILTDFIAVLENTSVDSESNNSESSGEIIRKFNDYIVSAPKDSLTYITLVSPYLSMLKGGAGISAGDFDIAIEKVDNTLK